MRLRGLLVNADAITYANEVARLPSWSGDPSWGMLGISDCFSANADDPAAIDARIDALLVDADASSVAFRKAAPKAQLGICLATPSHSREESFPRRLRRRACLAALGEPRIICGILTDRDTERLGIRLRALLPESLER